jgi:hypothetical protein
LDWFPTSGEERVIVESTGLFCPKRICLFPFTLSGEWFTLGISLENIEDENLERRGQIEINEHIESHESWEEAYIKLGEGELSINESSNVFIEIGNSFNGIIHSFEILADQGQLEFENDYALCIELDKPVFMIF